MDRSPRPASRLVEIGRGERAHRLPFIEGDDHHPPENVAHMADGHPLTDGMRVPWLDAIVAAAREAGPAVISCSALRRRHRERLRAGLSPPMTARGATSAIARSPTTR